MTAFQKISHKMFPIVVLGDNLPTINQAIVLCMTLIDRFKDNDEIRERTCEVLFCVLYVSFEVPYDHKKVSEKLLQLYQFSGQICYVQPFLAFIRVYEMGTGGRMWFFKHSFAIFEQACFFLSHEGTNHHPQLLRYIMELLHPILMIQYEKVLLNKTIGNLISLASQGLLSSDEQTFFECQFVIKELFQRSPSPIHGPSKHKNPIVVSLFNANFRQIVQNCIENILRNGDPSYYYSSAEIICIMNNAEKHGINSSLTIDEELVEKSLEHCRDKIGSHPSVFDDLWKIIEASKDRNVNAMASDLNRKLTS
ncbi:hypothetical protein RF11_08296 [Thelohanellus kitauei]|uniref:Uncharacterized protein n=1 Tax=Thelohanellus kitauei TaxID=669202 RepID=A0A0C2J0U4_THEKT|nr:hypothetical protein RF11_08296 [Thelohanellus kitauei]